MLLTIGLPYYDDYDGLFFTVQALLCYNNLALDKHDVEILVVDNNPTSPQGRAAAEFIRKSQASGRRTILRYVPFPDAVGTAAAKNAVFAHAYGEYVLCLDSHVLLGEGRLEQLLSWLWQDRPGDDLYHGVLTLNNGQNHYTHMDLVWRSRMWGRWACDPHIILDSTTPYEIPNNGLGLFLTRRASWPGFHPAMRGFGGEEGYLQEKYRRLGRRVYCLPWLFWIHRFHPKQLPQRHPVRVQDKFRNYALGLTEIGYDTTALVDHFAEVLPRQQLLLELRQIRAAYGPRPPKIPA